MSEQRSRRDAGLTLPELLITTMITGVIILSISAAMTTFLRSERPTQNKLSESKDITFLQTWIPLDLASAVSSDRTPTLQPATSQTLPGTNVLTISRPDVTGPSNVYYTVSYRYVNVGTEWQLVRFEIRKPGTANETVSKVGVAHELPAPPDGWTPDQSPTFAVEVTARNQVIIRPIGEDIEVTFKSGQQFATGGAGMSSEDQLPTDYSGGFTDPSAPPSRCGRTIALVIDTSGSVPQQGGGVQLQQAAAGFVDAFTGTPSRISVVGFDRRAYSMSPTTPGTFVPMLNSSAALTALRARILQIDDRDFNWNQSSPDLPIVDGVHWDQIGSGTNWEDGLWLPFRDQAGVPYPNLPDLVVFITDGTPTMTRATTGSTTVSTSAATTPAITAANYGRGTGAQILGILVGNQTNTSNVDRLKQVVGNVQWNGTGPLNPGNAGAADVFVPANGGSFSDLGNVLRSIVAAQCGGTVTIQKRLETSPGVLSDPTTTWSYTTDVGVRDLDPSTASSITFDYTFATGTTSKVVQVSETPQEGWQYDRTECTVAGVAVSPASRVGSPPDGEPGALLEIHPDEAMSCIMISVPQT